MKKKINLLIYHEKYKKTQTFFLTLRKIIYFLLFSSILTSFLLLVILNDKKNRLYNELINKKNSLEDQISKKQNVDIAYQIFSRKFLQLKNILDSDVNFYPYYKLIDDSLKKATISAFLESIEITKNKETNFTISFNNFDELINFLDYIEDTNFLSHFNQLTLKNITLNQENMLNKTDKKYNLNLVGQFKK